MSYETFLLVHRLPDNDASYIHWLFYAYYNRKPS